MEQAMLDRVQRMIDDETTVRFPADAVRRLELLQHGDDPWIEPGDLLVRVFMAGDGEDPPLRAWERDHEAMIRELHRELAGKAPGRELTELTARF